jgi:transketolase
MRFGRFACPIVTEGHKFELGKGVQLRDGKDVTLVATGYMVHLALEAAEELAKEGIDARVINIHTIKPLDKEIILKAAEETGAIVTAEEHNIIGGLGSAVAEAVCEEYPVPVIKVGVEDKFGKSGKVPPLLEEYGLTSANIAAKARIAVSKKK